MISGLTKKEVSKLVQKIGGKEKVKRFIETGILDTDIIKVSVWQSRKEKAAHQEWCAGKGC